MSTPAVGPIVALTYASAIDDPGRFKSSKRAGAHFGLTPKKYQSGETDVTGRISKIGDASVRTALYEAAHIMLTRPVKGCSQLKSWAMRIARRAGMKKAKVALARKLAVILHRMLANGTPFNRRRPRQPNRETRNSFRAGHDTSLPEAKSLRRDDGSGQAAAHQSALRPRTRRLVGLSSSTPSGGGLAPTPYRSETPAKTTTQKGIDQSRPVTEGWAKPRSGVPTSSLAQKAWARR